MVSRVASQCGEDGSIGVPKGRHFSVPWQAAESQRRWQAVHWLPQIVYPPAAYQPGQSSGDSAVVDDEIFKQKSVDLGHARVEAQVGNGCGVIAPCYNMRRYLATT